MLSGFLRPLRAPLCGRSSLVCASLRGNELEVSAAIDADLHCSLFCPTNRQMCELHRVMADLVNSLHPAALRVTAACPAKDSRLPLAACPSDTLPPRRAWSDRKSHRLDRCNNRVG